MHAVAIYDSIICFGDSLTQQASQIGGFVGQLQDYYQRRLEIVSRGFSGYTSRQALALCPKLFTPDETKEGTRARLVVVWFGTNDSISPGHDQHVPLVEFQKNMTSILGFFPSTHVLLITPGTVVPGRFEGHEDDRSMVQYGQSLYGVADQINKQRQEKNEDGKVAVVDMNDAFLKAAKKVEGGIAWLLTEDGLHINQAGYQVVFETIQEAIRTEYPELNPDQIPFVFAPWAELDLSKDGSGQAEQLIPRR